LFLLYRSLEDFGPQHAQGRHDTQQYKAAKAYK
jgi:hypothetical protein